MEKESRIESWSVKYFCDEEKCKGVVVFTGEVLTSYPPIYIHKCEDCGKQYKLRISYPYIRNKEVFNG